MHVKIEPRPLYASELSALAEDDRIEYMPVAAGRQKMGLPLLVPKRPSGSSFLPSSRPEDTYFKRAVMCRSFRWTVSTSQRDELRA
jgi:hypothetical protein